MLQTLNNLSLCRRAKELIDVKTSRTGNEGGLRRPQDQPDLLSNCEVWKLPTIYGDTIGLATLVLQQEDKYKSTS